MEGLLVQYAGEIMSSIVMSLLAFVAYRIKKRDVDFKEMAVKVIATENLLKVSHAEVTVKLDHLEKQVDFMHKWVVDHGKH